MSMSTYPKSFMVGDKATTINQKHIEWGVRRVEGPPMAGAPPLG
jgi:hypothetical protein